MTAPRSLELLAPAKNAAFGCEAIKHGADAVYIGGPAFGARYGAGSSVAEIQQLCDYAHSYHAKVFVALNTILHDSELEAARQLAWQLYDAGADALIIQDMGLLELDLPPIQLHASTQTDIRHPEKARFLTDVGFSQIVLARELSLAEIRAIAARTDVALEYFVHGALCVAFSGQCYISHAHTGRSANRGECSQACRLPYSLVDDKGRTISENQHLLSMKDNNQSDNLLALIEAGVTSFKIEGRLKDLAYVKNITAHYRTLLDEIIDERHDLARAASGRCSFTFTPDPNQNFNREFTDYFVQGRKEDIGAFDSPKNPGRGIGWVSKINDDSVELEIDPELTLHNGDGLCYYDLQKELMGLQVNRVEHLSGGNWRIFPKDAMDSFKDLRKGVGVNRNRDMDWVRGLEKKSAERKIDTWLALDAIEGGVELRITDEDGCNASAQLLAKFALADKPEQAREQLQANLGALGETIFTPLVF